MGITKRWDLENYEYNAINENLFNEVLYVIIEYHEYNVINENFVKCNNFSKVLVCFHSYHKSKTLLHLAQLLIRQLS